MMTFSQATKKEIEILTQDQINDLLGPIYEVKVAGHTVEFTRDKPEAIGAFHDSKHRDKRMYKLEGSSKVRIM